MTKNELWKLYCQKEKEFERAKGRRAIKTILFFAVVIFLIIYLLEKPTGFDIVGDFLVSIIFSGVHVVVNAAIFGQLSDVSAREKMILEDIKGKMDEA